MVSSSLVVSALKDSRLSNTAIANATGICSLSILHYRRGVSTPNHVNTRKLASFFGVKEMVDDPSLMMGGMDYEDIIRKKDAQIDQLMAMIAQLTGMKKFSGNRS